MSELVTALRRQDWYVDGRGPRYKQMYRCIAGLISSGALASDDQLPSERELAQMSNVSRVTVRKAIAELAGAGLIEQRRGAGSFVCGQGERFEQSLSSLVSFSENLQARGIAGSSKVLLTGLFRPTASETSILGLAPHHQVARIHRLRSGDGVPIALEHSSLPEDVLPRPDKVPRSLYEILRARGIAPIRAIQRVTAVNASAPVADALSLPQGSAVLQIERTGFSAAGRAVEFTSGLYRSDIYDFVSELRLD